MNDNIECSLAEGFSLPEKAYAQISFFTMGVMGTVGIVLGDWPWVLPYILIYWYGIPGIVMRHINCPRCPHLYEYGDCLQAPVRITRWLVKERKTGSYSPFEKFLFYAIFTLIPAYPIYWLLPNKMLLAAFLVAAGMWYGGQFLYFCKRCRVYDCPFNRVPLAVK
jgi:hypothetical protein